MRIKNVNCNGLMSAVKGCAAGFVLMLVALELGAQARPSNLPANPKELVRQVVANEMKAGSDGHYMYRDTKEKEDGSSVTKETIDTRDGVLARVVAINGKPLTPSQRDKEDKRLQRLLNDPNALAAKRKDQQEDEARIRKMVSALPDAFDYQYAGTERGPHGELVTLNFKPNPNYDPPSREQQVYTGMSGQMVLDLGEYRLAKIDGTLFRDVNFGWGILGKLDRGGKFIVEQADIGNGHWEPVRMVLNFTGKVFVFKPLKIKSVETTSDYRRVPDTLTVAQAVEMLKKADGVVAENGANGNK